MYPWCQCLLFFCTIVCSDAYRERSLSNDSLNFQTIEKSISKTLLKLLQSPDVQHPANQLPVWKLQAVSNAPSRYPISHQYRHLRRPQKWYNGRLIKRAVENPDKFMIAFRAAVKEAVRELFAENKVFSARSNMADLWSKVDENTGHLPSDTEVNFLRSIDFHSEDTASDYVHEPQPSLEYSTSTRTQGIQIWSTMRSLFTSKPEGTSVDLSNEQVSLKFQPDLQTQQSVTTLPSGTTQSFHYSNTANAEKSKPYMEVTTAPSSSNTFNLSPLTLSGSQSSETQESSNSITKDPFTVVTNPVLKSLTLGNILTSSFKTSAENLDTAELPIIEKYTTDPDLVDLTVTKSADLFSSARESLSPIKHSSSPIQHYIPQRDHTSNPNFMSANPYTKRDLSQSTFVDSRLSILTANGKLADVSHITSSKEKPDPSLKIESTTVTAIRSDFSATQIYTPETSEITGNKEDPANTAGTLLRSTLSSPKHFSSTEGNIASTEAASFETNYEMLSTVTPLPIMGRDDPACTLKVRNTTTTMQMPLSEQTTYENDRSVYFARIKTSLNPKTESSFTSALSPTELPSTVALSPFTDLYSTDPKEEDLSIVPLYSLLDTLFPEPTKLDPSETFSSFTDAYSASPESTESPQTTLSLSDYDTFNDAINGNENANQMTPYVTRTKSSTFLPFLFSKNLSRTPSWKSASPFIQTERFAALQTEANRQGFKPNSTTKNVQFYSSNHMTPQSQAIPSASSVDSSVSQYATSSFTLNPFLTISQSRSQTTGKHLSSTRASEASSKVWEPLSSVSPTSIVHAERSVAFQTAADRQGFNLSTMSSKSSISYSSTYITPQSQTILSRTHMTSAVSQSVTSTVFNALFTLPQSRNKTTIRHSSTSTSEKPSQTSTPKIWTPQSSVAPSESATPAIPPSRATIFGAPPLRSTSDVFPPKSTSGAFPSKSSSFGSHTEKNARSLSTKHQRHPISTTPKFSKIYSSTLIGHQSQAIPSTTRGTFSLPWSVTYTSTLKPPFTVSQSKTKTMTTKSSTRTSSAETLGFKDWIPQASDVIPTKLAASVPAKDKGLSEIQTMPHATLSSTSAVGTVPLTFHLTGVSYSEQLGNHTTDEYKSLEKEVLLVLNKVFSTKYQQEFVQAQILGFSKGSVVVTSYVLFGSRTSTPSGSDIVRTVLSDDYATKNNYFGWKINASTVECKGYTPRNLEQESLSISFVVLHFGFIAISQNYQEKHDYLESLQKEILRAIDASFQVTNVSFLQIRDFHGDLEVRGILYLESRKFTNVQVLLSTLLPLANVSVDLRSITVEGMHNELKVYPFNFRITNTRFAVSLLDMASTESQKLSKDLSKVIELALHDKSLLQVVIQEFYSGSVVCKGDLIYRFPAPGSREVLRQFLQALTSDGMLGSSSYKVDFQSVTIDDSTSSPYNEYTDFPGFAVAIIVMCGLSILIFPSLVFVCYKTRMLGHRNKATIHQRHNPDQQSHHFEMDNRAFRASIEQP